MALLACLLGYGEVGLWLKRQALLPNSWVVVENNPYKAWMDDYAGEMYQAAVQVGLGSYLVVFDETFADGFLGFFKLKR